MKFVSFFKLLNRKINSYNKTYAENPFINKNPINLTIIWVEDTDSKKKEDGL